MNSFIENNQKSKTLPKKILSLDGGGIRGIFALGILKEIETQLRSKLGKPNLRLGEYYDLIGGTSTGAIIASGLAIGMEVDEIISLYNTLGEKIFGQGLKYKFLKREWKTLRAIFKENYSSKRIEKYFDDVFGDLEIGNKSLKCGLAIITKRADTYSHWIVTNHPAGIYFEANKHLKIKDLCRASSAAPYYFKPKKLKLKKRSGEEFDATFIDGGVSLANNPAWHLFLVGIVPSFGYCWETGFDKIYITSLGTGNGLSKEDPNALEDSRAIDWAPKLSDLFMVDALEMNQVLLQMFGVNKSSHHHIDSQFADLKGVELAKEKLFSFERHNIQFTNKSLKAIGFDLSAEKIDSLKEMDHFENMDQLLEIGQAYAKLFGGFSP